VRNVLLEAGRQLAVLNSVPVEGFAWLVRAAGGPLPLMAEHPFARAFLSARLATDLALLASTATPILHADGRYCGIIDFSEARGAGQSYDLGYFHLHDGHHLIADSIRREIATLR
jgi:hypothetical protein